MDASFVVIQLLTGLASASSLFITASGLTLVFGVTRIVNFAHGSFYMLGAYLAVTIIPRLFELDRSFPMFALGVLMAALIIGLIGVAIEMILLRRIYRAPEIFQLLATFGVVLVVQDLVIKIWGPLDMLGPRVPDLPRSVEILGQRMSTYDLLLIAIGPIVLGSLWLLMQRTRFGVLIRAATQDREMVGALGVDQAKLFTATLFLGSFLAGLGGALQIPRAPATPAMDIAIISETFVVTVVGGMGSIPGAFLAALLIGLLQAFGVLVFPKITLVLVFALMAVVLVVRPYGFLGRPDANLGAKTTIEGVFDLRPLDRTGLLLVILLVAIAAALPLWGDAYALKVGIEALCFALAAFALNLLIGVGGMVSFGHAAWFGIGAYAAGLLTVKQGLSMIPALVSAPIAAAAAAAFFGYFIVRLSGIYLAMLTLAVAQLVYALCFQWVDVTGGDNGVVGVWPSSWASSRPIYYLLTFALAAASIYTLRRAIYAPFGYALRAARELGRCAPKRRESTCSGSGWSHSRLRAQRPGLAGGLYAFSKGSIDPTLISIPMSVDFLIMVLIGGLQTIFGPIIGADLPACGERFRHAADRHVARLARRLDHHGRADLSAWFARRTFPASLAFGCERRAMTILAVKGIAKSFGGVTAAKNVSFDVAPGEMVALIGPNGAGKSTVFNMVGGQLAPDSGQIFLAGENVAGLPPRLILQRGVARTFQIAQAFLSMSVIENIQMAIVARRGETLRAWTALRDFHREEADALLRQVGMQDDAARLVAHLAYADIKRVEIALALAAQPKLLLMDEPTAGMAVAERRELMALVRVPRSRERDRRAVHRA